MKKLNALTIFYWVSALLALTWGSAMLAFTETWFNTIYSLMISDTHAIVSHFIRVVGGVFLLMGLTFIWAAKDKRARSKLHAGITIFFILTALIHTWSIFDGTWEETFWTPNLFLAYLPAIIMILTALPKPRLTKGEKGQVKWFDTRKGFGFISRSNGEEIFVHYRSIHAGGHRSLREGQWVEFTVVTSDKGLQAENVRRIRQP